MNREWTHSTFDLWSHIHTNSVCIYFPFTVTEFATGRRRILHKLTVFSDHFYTISHLDFVSIPCWARPSIHCSWLWKHHGYEVIVSGWNHNLPLRQFYVFVCYVVALPDRSGSYWNMAFIWPWKSVLWIIVMALFWRWAGTVPSFSWKFHDGTTTDP